MSRSDRTAADARSTLIREAIERLRVDPKQLIEMRVLGIPMQGGRTFNGSGYYNAPKPLIRDAISVDNAKAAGIYITLNPVQPDLLARACNQFKQFAKTTTSDVEIVRRIWLPLDFDPARPAGIAATDTEMERARVRAIDAVAWLRSGLGVEPDIYAFSGNGYHALYRIDLPNDSAATDRVRRIIEITASRFSDQAVKVDRTVFNAARIWRLYGTTNRKGDEIEGRQHRLARIMGKDFT